MNTKIDLFQNLVNFLAIKPLKFDTYDLEKAKLLIKEENKKDITFIGDHSYFEDVLDTVEKRIGNLQLHEGILYIYIKGDNSRQRIERNLLNIVLYVKKIYIIGDANEWKFNDPKIEFLNLEDKFAENHQRFLVFNSPTYNIALTARHAKIDGQTKTEAALTNKKEAVSFLSQILAPLFYKKQI